VLETKIPLLNVRSAQTAINRAKLESLGDVSASGLARRRVVRVKCSVRAANDGRIVAYLVDAASVNDSKRQELIEREAWVLL
jgi:hypothetical protein